MATVTGGIIIALAVFCAPLIKTIGELYRGNAGGRLLPSSAPVGTALPPDFFKHLVWGLPLLKEREKERELKNGERVPIKMTAERAEKIGPSGRGRDGMSQESVRLSDCCFASSRDGGDRKHVAHPPTRGKKRAGEKKRNI